MTLSGLTLPLQKLVIVLPDAENRTIVCTFVWTKHWNVTDGRTELFWLLQRNGEPPKWRHALNHRKNPRVSRDQNFFLSVVDFFLSLAFTHC